MNINWFIENGIKNTNKALVVFLCVCGFNFSHAQNDSLTRSIYQVSYKWELPVGIGFLGSSYFVFHALNKHASLTQQDVNKLDRFKINAFDQPVAFYNHSRYEREQFKSDITLAICFTSPVLLTLNRQLRNDLAKVLTMFMMTHVSNTTLYFISVASVRRARPLSYNPALEMKHRTGSETSNSFFSGHVSSSAASTFFLAKIITDNHQIKGLKRVLIYTMAAFPPALTGYYRMTGGKHFRTDVLTGLVVGGACGILIPELHRKKREDVRWSLQPYYMPANSGLCFYYRLK